MNPHALVVDTKLLNFPVNLPGIYKVLDISKQIQVQYSTTNREKFDNMLLFNGKLIIQILYEEKSDENSVKLYNMTIPFISFISDVKSIDFPLTAKIKHFKIELFNSHTFSISYVIYVSVEGEVAKPINKPRKKSTIEIVTETIDESNSSLIESKSEARNEDVDIIKLQSTEVLHDVEKVDIIEKQNEMEEKPESVSESLLENERTLSNGMEKMETDQKIIVVKKYLNIPSPVYLSPDLYTVTKKSNQEKRKKRKRIVPNKASENTTDPIVENIPMKVLPIPELPKPIAPASKAKPLNKKKKVSSKTNYMPLLSLKDNKATLTFKNLAHKE